MKVAPFIAKRAIEGVAAVIGGSSNFERIKGVVERQEEKPLPGADKRQAVLSEIEVIGIAVAGWLANLLIELAVAWFRQEAIK